MVSVHESDRTLDYSSGEPRSDAERQMSRHLRDALLFAAAPLFVGPGILVAYERTHWAWLVVAGLVTLVAGLGSVIIAGIELGGFILAAHRTSRLGPGAAGRAAGVTLLMVADFGAAYVCVELGARAMV
jgi:hypothetical protein